jgi:hypothetical protein
MDQIGDEAAIIIYYGDTQQQRHQAMKPEAVQHYSGLCRCTQQIMVWPHHTAVALAIHRQNILGPQQIATYFLGIGVAGLSPRQHIGIVARIWLRQISTT